MEDEIKEFNEEKYVEMLEDGTLYDCITNLQEELKEYKMLFDAFSERPYAHKYLEEKKKELGNNKIIGLDSEMIYKDYYDLKEENERLHKELDYANNDNIYYIAKIDKAIEYIKENIADIEFMEENYDLDFLNKNEIEVEYKDIKKLIELLEDKYE